MRAGRYVTGLLNPIAEVHRVMRPVDTLAQHRRGLHTQEAAFVQLKPGLSRMHSVRTVGQDLSLTSLYVPYAMSGFTVSDPEWVILHAPLRWRGDYFVDGREVSPGDALLVTSRNGYFGRGEDRDAITIGIRLDRLSSAMRSLSGRTHDDVALHHRFMKLPYSLMTTLIDALCAPHRASGNRGSAVERLSPTCEADIIALIAQALLTSDGKGVSERYSTAPATTVVANARACALNAEGRSPSLADLCAASQVGLTRLTECFHQVHGMSPGRYFTALRLAQARERLTDVLSPPRSVKEVALDFGFTKSGRFSQSFEEQYGEYPSTVLKRTKSRNDIVRQI